MIAYRIPLKLPQPQLQLKNTSFKRVTVEINSVFNPLELLDIFEHGQQIKVIERPTDSIISQYLALITPKLGSGFKYVVRAGQAVSTQLLADNTLPDQIGRDTFLAELDHLSELYTDLIGCPNIGVRLEVLNSAMCPRFHVDKTGIRLLCTYLGQGTQWLEEAYADRTKLGFASANIDDGDSGLILDSKGVHQAQTFAVVLLKGSLWQGNHMRGIIHRSPPVLDNKPRVMLAIDAMW